MGYVRPRNHSAKPAGAALLALLAFFILHSSFFKIESSAGPTTAPVHSDLQAWFARLADPDVKVRTEAMVRLMGTGAADLPALRRLVEESRPLAPEQAVALRQIVTQAFIASEPYDKKDDDGFLGVFLPASEAFSSDAGVAIVERMPGFVGMRMLRDGDVILGIIGPGNRHIRVQNGTDLSEALKGIHAGTTLHFQVLRQGQVISVVIRLDARPLEADNGPDAMREFNRLRLARADEYWKQHFSDLMRQSVS
jgi:hypothetical protein